MRGQARSRRPSWLLFLIFGALVSATYFAVSSPVVKVVSFGVLGAAPVPAMLIGVWMHRPRYPMSWFLFAVGLLVFNVGDMIFYVHEYLLLREPPFPSVADVFYLATYPCLIAGLLLLIKHRSPGRNRASLVDALIVAISMGLLSWEFLMVPYLRERGLSLSERLTSLAYPLMDILVLAVTARLWSDGGVRNGAFHLLSLSLVPLLLADTLYGLIQLTGTWHLGSPVDVGWMLFYVCWGAAAMHPSMRQLDRPAPTATVKITRARFGVLLALASLMAPIVLAVQVALGHPVDTPAVVGGSLLLFLLALVRMSGIVQALRITLTKHERSVARETTLREAAEAFVAATTRDSIHTAALDAVLALSKDPRRTTVRIADGDQGNLKIVAAAGEPGKVIGTVFDLSKLAGSNLDLDGGTVVTGWAEAQELYERLQLDPALGSLLLLPLRLQRGLGGVLVVASRWRQPDEIVEALQALSAQVALALESATLTEDLHQRRSDERFRRLVQNSSDLITVMETDSTIRYQTPSVQRVLGYEADELIGRKLAELIHPDDAASLVALLTGTSRDGVNGPIECRMRCRDRRWVSVETISTHVDDDLQGYVLTSRDVTDRKILEDQLKHQAFHDSLTKLANRALFTDRVQHVLNRQQRHGLSLAVLFLDSDDFKTINDSLGHVAGDELLCAVADRLRVCLRSADTAARLGGDEFAVLLEDLADMGEATAVAERIITSLQTPFTLHGKEVFARASIGIALADLDHQQVADELLSNADMAMYIAKSNGKARYEVFAQSMHAAVVERLELTAALRRALERTEFVVHYQPIVELATGTMTGVEALVRWQHPQRGLLAPGEFIALAEETGLILPLGRFVLEQACQRGAHWHTPVRPSSDRECEPVGSAAPGPWFVSEVHEILASTGLPAQCLTLEITETVLMQDTQATVEKLSALKQLGVRVAIDDFGTGYSSLSYLQQLPIDILKIPKPFIDGILTGSEDSGLARAIIKLAGTLQLEAIAEGIEEPEQWTQLRELSCPLGQGYLFSRAVDPNAIDALVDGRLELHGDSSGPQRPETTKLLDALQSPQI